MFIKICTSKNKFLYSDYNAEHIHFVDKFFKRKIEIQWISFQFTCIICDVPIRCIIRYLLTYQICKLSVVYLYFVTVLEFCYRLYA